MANDVMDNNGKIGTIIEKTIDYVLASQNDKIIAFLYLHHITWMANSGEDNDRKRHIIIKK